MGRKIVVGVYFFSFFDNFFVNRVPALILKGNNNRSHHFVGNDIADKCFAGFNLILVHAWLIKLSRLGQSHI